MDGRRTTTVDVDRRGGVWGGGAVLIISKNLPLKGKFFEMVSWGGLGGLAPLRNLRYPCLAPRGGLGGFAPRNLRYLCLAPAGRRTDGEKSKNEPKRRTDLKI